MPQSHQSFVAEHYGSRAQAYVDSIDHRTGEDLDQIEALLRDIRPSRALDLGCGGGHVSYRAAPHVSEMVACDVTPDMLTAVAKTASERGLANLRVQQAAAEKLPFTNDFFDVVLCRFSTHHWHDMDAGLREARRVLKTGGTGLFVDVVSPADRVLDTHLQAVELLRDPSHVRNYTVAEWIGSLSRSRFSVETITNRKLRMQFPTWIARTGTSMDNAKAIRSLQINSPSVVRDHFAIGEDGGFDLDTIVIVVR